MMIFIGYRMSLIIENIQIIVLICLLKPGFPDVIGAIDCTHIKIAGPSENEEEYVNCKGFHSINVQMICDPTFKFTNIVAKWPGSVHDARIWRESDICAKFERAFSCNSTTPQYKRPGDNVTIQFQAWTVNTVDSSLTVTNQILSNNTDSPLLSVLYKNGVMIYKTTCNNCTFTGNADTGDLSIRIDNLQTSNGGTYKHLVNQASGEVKGCILVYMLGQPTKPSITITKVPFEGGSTILTCRSTSTTTPSDQNLQMRYNWTLNNSNIPNDSRYTYSSTRNQLTISNVNRNDANKQYTCIAKEDVSNAYISARSDSLKFDVYYKPDLGPLIKGLSQVFNNNTEFSAIKNRQQTLNCSVTGGYPLPSLSWSGLTGTEQNLSSGQTITKSITWTASTNGTCKCTSTQMNATSDVVLNVRILSLPTSPKFWMNSREVQSSSTVKIIKDSTTPIYCSSNSSPSPEYKWTYNGQTTEVSQEARLNPSQVTKDGPYYCYVENKMIPSLGSPENGNSSDFINIETLFEPSKPQLRYHDQNGAVLTQAFQVVKGDNFNMYCSSTGNPSPNYVWTGNGRLIRNQTIIVSNIQDNRTYSCKATNTMNPTFLISVTRSSTSTVSVNVLSPATQPTIKYHYSETESVSISSTLKVIKGKSFRVSCTSSGIPTPTLSWSEHTSSNTNTLVITSIERNVRFICTAINYMNRTYGMKETVQSKRDLQIEILYGPTVKPFNVEPIIEGSTLSVECKADPGNPASMTYSWKRLLKSTSTSIWQDIPGSSINRGQLTKPNINRSDAGTYKCIASNVMKPTAENQQNGTGFQTFLLDVQYKASIQSFVEVSASNVRNITIHENDTFSIECMVDSNPGSTIFILKRSENIASVDDSKHISYNERQASCDSAGTYTCVGFNKLNDDENKPSKELFLYVTCSPRLYSAADFNSQVRSAVGERVKLEIKIKAFPVPEPSDIIWSKHNGNTSNILIDSDNIKINNSGLELSLMFLSVKVSDFQQYSVAISNQYGTLHEEFYLQPYGKPNPPENVDYMDGSLTQTSVMITWMPGFHGGLNQTFHVKYKKQIDSKWQEVTKPDEGTANMNLTLSGLEPGTSYVFQLYSRNSEGSSSETEILTFTTVEKTDPGINAALIAGVVTGSVVFIVAAAILVLLVRRFAGGKGMSKSYRNDNDRRPVYEDESEYGMRDNPMYESAGPKETNRVTESPSNSTAAVYSTVNKTVKTSEIDNEYAAVMKTKKSTGKQAKKEKEKRQQGLFKDKTGKKELKEGDIYENTPAKDELIYENPEPSKPTMKKNVNKDGLIYADLTFNDQPKGQKKLIIHGLDDMTEYVEVDFTKKAEPLPDSDEEDIPANQ